MFSTEMMILMMVGVAVCVFIVFVKYTTKQRDRIREREKKFINDLLSPEISLKCIVTALKSVYPASFTDGGALTFRETDRKTGLGYEPIFYPSTAVKIADVFVRNADMHYELLGNGLFKNGESLAQYVIRELFKTYGRSTIDHIRNTPISDEAKQRLLAI